ncbi:hypothetical protein [Lactobacillus sp. Sy-1]|uniref:hypothetical protein n=1 Tax=Lactobacillus sp. Sy-1 TaxID=2109645 RepID=UPI001C5A01FF|nr:hypothetical protein [Lactobacillus sp. Sy-1]MBW1605123.1 hypothetical protein [Lactobacillus sp. Sy-1]
MAKNLRIVELADSGLPVDLMAMPAINVDKAKLHDLLYQSQYKSENQGIYIAKHASYHPDSDTYDAEEPYDQYLDHAIDAYLADFEGVRKAAEQHFHREMSVGYYIELFIAQLHRKFENHQDSDSLVMVDGYEKELKALK